MKVAAGTTNTTPPWEPSPATSAEVSAIQGLFAGTATADQQRTFLEWMVKATGIDSLEFRPGGERESNFASGKRFVGMQFFSLGKTKIPQPR